MYVSGKESPQRTCAHWPLSVCLNAPPPAAHSMHAYEQAASAVTGCIRFWLCQDKPEFAVTRRHYRTKECLPPGPRRYHSKIGAPLFRSQALHKTQLNFCRPSYHRCTRSMLCRCHPFPFSNEMLVGSYFRTIRKIGRNSLYRYFVLGRVEIKLLCTLIG